MTAAAFGGPFLIIDLLTGSAFKQRSSKIEVKLSELNDKEVAP